MLRSISVCVILVCAWPICSAQGNETLIRAGELLDVRSGEYVKDQGIFISEGKIREIGPFAKVRAGHPATATIDLSARYVLPGLIDCHTHLLSSVPAGTSDDYNMLLTAAGMSTAERALLGARNARQVLESGITTVRDVGNSGVNGDVALRNAIDRGWVVGPRILASTRALALPGAQFPVAMNPEVASAIWNQEYAIVANVEEARAAVRNAIASGARVIKVIGDSYLNLFTVEELKAIVEIAHQVHIKVAVHAVYEPEVHAAALAGVDSIEHAYAITDEDLELMRKNNVYLVPTDWPLQEIIATSALPAGATTEERKAEELFDKKAIAVRQERLRHAMVLGVKIAFGSDWYYDLPDHTRGEESLKTLDAYAEAGMTPIAIIRSATIDAADLLGWTGKVGVIEPGAYADVTAFAADPLVDVKTIGRVAFVMKDGAVIKPNTP